METMANKMVMLFAFAHRENTFGKLSHILEISNGLVVENLSSVYRKRVIDRGHTMRYQLTVNLIQRSEQVHNNARSRRCHRLDVIGVNIDHAWNHIGATRIHHRETSFPVNHHARRVLVKLRVNRASIGKRRRNARNGSVFNDDVVVGQNRIFGNHITSANHKRICFHKCISPCIGLSIYAALVKAPPGEEAHLQQRIHQLLSVGMLRVFQNLIGKTVLHNLPIQHHERAIG